MSLSPSSPPVRGEFAKRLKALRVPRGYPTARSFALALKIDENRYTRYERAEVEPDLSLFARICTILNVTPNDLLGFSSAVDHASGLVESAPLADAIPHSPLAASQRRALAWRLADELCKLDHAGGRSFDRLSRVSTLFGEIDADTYGFMVQLPKDKRFSGIDHPASGTRIAEIAAALMTSLNSEVLAKSNARAPGTQS